MMFLDMINHFMSNEQCHKKCSFALDHIDMKVSKPFR